MKNAQGLVEYVLVFIFATVVAYFFASRFDMGKIKNFAIYGIRQHDSQSKIIIPPMTE